MGGEIPPIVVINIPHHRPWLNQPNYPWVSHLWVKTPIPSHRPWLILPNNPRESNFSSPTSSSNRVAISQALVITIWAEFPRPCHHPWLNLSNYRWKTFPTPTSHHSYSSLLASAILCPIHNHYCLSITLRPWWFPHHSLLGPTFSPEIKRFQPNLPLEAIFYSWNLPSNLLHPLRDSFTLTECLPSNCTSRLYVTHVPAFISRPNHFSHLVPDAHYLPTCKTILLTFSSTGPLPMIRVQETAVHATRRYTPLSTIVFVELLMWPHSTLQFDLTTSPNGNKGLTLPAPPRDITHTPHPMTLTHLQHLDHTKCTQRIQNFTWHSQLRTDSLNMINFMTTPKISTPHKNFHRTHTPPQLLLQKPRSRTCNYDFRQQGLPRPRKTQENLLPITLTYQTTNLYTSQLPSPLFRGKLPVANFSPHKTTKNTDYVKMSVSATNKSAIATPNHTVQLCLPNFGHSMTNQFSRYPQHHSSKFNMESSSSSHQGSSSPLAPAASSSAGRFVSCITNFHNPNSLQCFLCNGLCSSLVPGCSWYGIPHLSSSLSMSGFLTWDHQLPLHTQIPVPLTVVDLNAYTLGFPCYPHPLSMDFPCAPSGCLSLASSSAELPTPWASAFISISSHTR